MPTDDEFRRVAGSLRQLLLYEQLVTRHISEIHELTGSTCERVNARVREGESFPWLRITQPSSGEWKMYFDERPLIEFKVSPGTVSGPDRVIATCAATLLNGEKRTRECYLVMIGGREAAWRGETVPPGGVEARRLTRGVQTYPLETEIDGAWVLGLIEGALSLNLEVYRQP